MNKWRKFRISLAISGMDGTGKTTISLELMRKLSKFGVPTMYIHGFSNPILSRLPVLSMLFGTGHKKMLSRPLSYKAKKSFLHNMELCIWHSVVFIEFLLYVSYVKRKNRTHIIVFDRFWYDRFAYMLARADDFFLLQIIYTKLFQIIKPDLSVFLKVGSTTAKERKKGDHDYSLDFYEKLANSYESIYCKISKNSSFIRINTEKADLDFITNEILKNFFNARYSVLSQIFSIAKKSRLEYALLCFLSSIGFKSPQISRLSKICKNKEKKVERALHHLSHLNSLGAGALLFKSYNVCITTLPNDIDILLRSDPRKSLLKLREISGNVTVSVRSPWEMEIFIPNTIEIEIAPHVMWFNTPFVSDELTFTSPRKVSVLNVELLTTNAVCDYLSRCAHALFGHFCLRFDEYLHILEVSKSLSEQEHKLVLNEVQRMGWKEGYTYFINELNKIQTTMCTLNNSQLDSGFKTPVFPYKFPYLLVSFFSLKPIFNNFQKRHLTLTGLFWSVLQYFKHTFLTYFYRLGEKLVAFWIKEV